MGHTLSEKEFATQDKCWDYFSTHPHMRRIHNNIPTTRPVMLFEIKSFGLGWITCVKRYKLNRNVIEKRRRPSNVLLPTPQ